MNNRNLPEYSGAPLFWMGCVVVIIIGCVLIALSPQTSFWGALIIGLSLLLLYNRFSRKG